jgi:hypothetical protein
MIDLQSIFDHLGLKESPCKIVHTCEHLRFYEMGAYFQSDEQSWIEINPKCKVRFLGYTLHTVIAHELIHAIRKDFPDSYWEELLAYQVCLYGYQRFLGPIFSLKSFRSFLAITLCLWWMTPYVMACFIPCLAVYLIRGYLGYRRLNRVKKRLLDQGFSDSLSFQKLIRLSPQELAVLSQKTPSGVRNF